MSFRGLRVNYWGSVIICRGFGVGAGYREMGMSDLGRGGDILG
jgi:hypothetical protein